MSIGYLDHLTHARFAVEWFFNYVECESIEFRSLSLTETVCLRSLRSKYFWLTGFMIFYNLSDLNSAKIVQLSNDIFLLKRVSRYGRCFMIDSGSKGCPEQESAGCHFGTLGRNFFEAKTKWPPNISRSNMIFQQMKPGTSVIPHFHVILTGQSISCIILMTQGHLQGQKDHFKVKEAKIPF